MSFTCWPAGVAQGDKVKGAAGSVGALVPEDPDEVEDMGSTWPSRPTVKKKIPLHKFKIAIGS